jgi:Fe-S cluster assembly scaffold protein SufB
MTAAPPAPTGEPAPVARTRPARRSPNDLTFRLDEALLETRAATEPDWLAADRRAALERFRALPIETNQLYTTYVDLRPADLSEVRAYDAPAFEASADAANDLGGAAALIELREDGIAALALEPAARDAGVTLETLGALVARDPEAARRLLADGASLPDDDRLAQLTRAAWNQGVAVRIPAGVKLDRPIVVRWAAGAPDRALLTRTVIELGDGAEAQLVEELVPSGAEALGRASLITGTSEIVLGSRARLAFVSLQELGPDAAAFQHRRARIGEGAELRWALAQLGGRLVRSRIDNVLAGDRSSVEQVEIVFGSGQQLFDLTSYTRHVGRDTTGNLLAKGVLLDQARNYMKGMITIERSAIGTDSYLGEFGMNLSKAARAVAIPSLEIDQPDCRRAAHASSVGPIDEGQVFYLRSRGIAEDEARKFIVLGFLEPVVARVPLPDVEERLRDLLDAKWDAGHGNARGHASGHARGHADQRESSAA